MRRSSIADIDGPAADALAAELERDGKQALAVVCDVADEQQVQAAVDAAVERFGGIDILINNAGKHLMKYNQPFSVLERDELRALFDVNVIGVVNCSVSARPSMAARGGGVHRQHLVDGLVPERHAVRGVEARGAGPDHRLRHRVRRRSHPRQRHRARAHGHRERDRAICRRRSSTTIVNEKQMIHRLGTMDDIVQAMLYLCSDESSFVTGETLRVTRRNASVPLTRAAASTRAAPAGCRA